MKKSLIFRILAVSLLLGSCVAEEVCVPAGHGPR